MSDRPTLRQLLARPARARHRPYRLQGRLAGAVAAAARRRGHRLRRSTRRPTRAFSSALALDASRDLARGDIRDAGARCARRSAAARPRDRLPPRRPAAGARSLSRAARRPIATNVHRHRSTCSRPCARADGVARGRRRHHRQGLPQPRVASWRYREDDPLGGHDPYSASKACAELVTAAYRASFFAATRGIARRHGARRQRHRRRRLGRGPAGPRHACARLQRGEPLAIRNPRVGPAVAARARAARRLPACSASALLAGDAALAEAWNFGPARPPSDPVGGHRRARSGACSPRAQGRHRAPRPTRPHEAGLLAARFARKARDAARLAPALGRRETLERTIAWYRACYARRPTDRRRARSTTTCGARRGRHEPLELVTDRRSPGVRGTCSDSPSATSAGASSAMYLRRRASPSWARRRRSSRSTTRSRSARRVRGMHFQRPPHAEVKLVSCLRGRGVRRRGRPAPRLADLPALARGLSSDDEHRPSLHPRGLRPRLPGADRGCELLYLHSAYLCRRGGRRRPLRRSRARDRLAAGPSTCLRRDRVASRRSRDEFAGA